MIYKEKDFSAAMDLWRGWNGKINVVSRKDMDNLFSHHVMHSLAIEEYLSRSGRSLAGSSVLDLGCGGGFPGIPLAMTVPTAEFTLCDSIGKKVKVAQAVSDGLGLSNVRCINARAETLEGPFDWVVSRAVTSLDCFYPWVKGRFRRSILYLKGGDVLAEVSELSRKCKVHPGRVTVWAISDWLSDDYFHEKYVVEITS